MQPLKTLARLMETLADADHYLFSQSDLSAVLGGGRQIPLLLCRAVKAGVLRRVCRGVYLYPRADASAGRILFHTAARLRAGEFTYISLETALSDAGVISQAPINWITCMSSGRSHVIDCGDFGHIEFVHTSQRPDDVEVTYDAECHLWRASVRQALRDMKATRRSMDLVDKEAAHELV
jgi:hypothetical protein